MTERAEKLKEAMDATAWEQFECDDDRCGGTLTKQIAPDTARVICEVLGINSLVVFGMRHRRPDSMEIGIDALATLLEASKP